MINNGIPFQLGPWKANGFSQLSRVTWLAVPALDAVFDIGWCVEAMRGIPNLFLSHLHQDHSLALPTWVSWRQPFADTTPPRIHVHPAVVDQTRNLVTAMARAEGYDLVYDVIGMPIGTAIPLKGNYFITAFETRHLIPTIGFIVSEKRKKLKASYRGMDGEAIRKARRRGEQVHEWQEFPLFCYLPDSDIKVFDDHPEVLDCDVLAVECSLLDGYLQFDSNDSSHQGEVPALDHMHIRPLSRYLEGFRGRHLYLFHLPRKYCRCDLRAYLLPRLPPAQRYKLGVFPYRSPDAANADACGARPSPRPGAPVPVDGAFLDEGRYTAAERPGFFGFHKERRKAALRERYPDHRIAYRWGDRWITRTGALQLYEDAYHAFLTANPELTAWLVSAAADVYDTAPSNVDAGLDYLAQSPDAATHLQDIAVRRCLARMGKWFQGRRLIRIRGLDSEGYALNPGIVPFHLPEMIVQPEIDMDWVLPGSIESFWQSNKYAVVPVQP